MSPAFAPEIPSLVLEPDVQAPQLARRFLAELFAEWGIEDDYIGRLVVCELVTNSYKHAKGRITVRVFVDDGDGRVVVEVEDGGDGRPVVRPESHTALDGRGMALLADLVDGWGVRPLAGGGKVTWARLR
ncbi:ATP-binding protein [Actinomadura sp. 3N508]|uniref:ATP-binding protein n=1 Tax=Actinomadura sp. 3N508 TaxID=3375153 RepID=UPI0037937867